MAAVVLLLYQLPSPPRRLSIPSALIWQRVLRERKRRPERLRWWLSLLLALCHCAVGGGRAHAARGRRRERHSQRCGAGDRDLPDYGLRAESSKTDARGWLTALERAERIIAERGAGSRYLIADTMRQTGVAAFEPRAAASARLLLDLPATGRICGLEAPSDADGPAQAPDRHQQWFLTDGVAPVEVPPGTRTVPAFQAVETVGMIMHLKCARSPPMPGGTRPTWR